MKFLIAVLLFLAAWPLLAADAVALSGALTSVKLLSDSKNQPAMAVLAGNVLFYTEAKNLETGKEEDCPAADLYRYDLTEKKEVRLAEISCVQNLLSDGTTAYAVYLDAKVGVSVGRVIDGKNWEPAPADSTEKMLPRVRLKRATLKLPRGAEIKLKGFTIREKQLNAVFQADGHLFFDAVVFDKPAKQAVLPFVYKSFPGFPLGFSSENHIYTFTKGEEGWLRVTETLADGTSSLLGHQRPLSKKWTEAGKLDWAVRTPRYLTGIEDGFLVADRTAVVFSEATAVSWYSRTSGKFHRLDIDDKDVGGLSYVLGGVLVSHPLTGSIVWYGKKNPFEKNEDKK